jgi:hypothetical protein
MRISLPYNFNLRPYQQPVWDAIVKRNVKRAITVWPRRNGKDLAAINILTAKASQRVGTYLYIAPFYQQVRQIIWKGKDKEGRRFLDYIPPEIIEKKLDSTMEIELINDSSLKLCGSDNIDAIVGTNPIGIIFTEFSLHKPDVWHYLRPILAENEGWALFNGTPRGLNHFYQLHKLAGKNSSWFSQYLTRDDTGIPTLEAIEEDRRSGMPESLIQQEYYCDWSASSEDVFIPLDIVKPAINNRQHLSQQDYDHAPRILGVDVAYAAKGDKAVIAARQGRMLYPFESYQGLDNMALASRVVAKIKDFKPNLVYVDAGRGEGVISRLFQLGYESIVIPVHFGGKTYDELYSNKKAEMYGRGRAWFLNEAKPCIPDNEDFVREISTPFFDMDEKHKIRIESKRQLRSRGEKSPDFADAFVLTFAEDTDNEDFSSTKRLESYGLDQQQIHNLFNEADPFSYDPLHHMEQSS